MMIGVKSPFVRRKKVEPPRHIKELIHDIVEQNHFKDRVKIEENAKQII